MSVWFITGSSRGLGRSLVRAALAAGHDVVASARRPDALARVVAEAPDHVFAPPLDVTDPTSVRAAVDAALDRFGRIDVVVNNAGYADLAPIETADESDVRRQFETDFWGVHTVSKAAIPVLRSQGGGTVVQVSSVGGRVGGSPGIAAYQAAKFAVDGFSRVLAVETAPFGIRVLVVEPSGFATDWAGSSMRVDEIPTEYDATVGAMHRRTRTAGRPAGDPDRAAEIVVRTVALDRMPSHLLLGANAVRLAEEHAVERLAETRRWAEVGRSADFDEPYPVPLPR